jgi:hypothetical protein
VAIEPYFMTYMVCFYFLWLVYTLFFLNDFIQLLGRGWSESPMAINDPSLFVSQLSDLLYKLKIGKQQK